VVAVVVRLNLSEPAYERDQESVLRLAGGKSGEICGAAVAVAEECCAFSTLMVGVRDVRGFGWRTYAT
jgi:hypothetical protein